MQANELNSGQQILSTALIYGEGIGLWVFTLRDLCSTHCFPCWLFCFCSSKSNKWQCYCRAQRPCGSHECWIPSSSPAAPGTHSSLHLSVCTALSIGLYLKNTGLKGTDETNKTTTAALGVFFKFHKMFTILKKLPVVQCILDAMYTAKLWPPTHCMQQN